MQSTAERILSADVPLAALQKELLRRDVYDGTTLFQFVLEVVIRNRYSTSLLQELLEFNRQRAYETGHYAQWRTTAIAHGNSDALSLTYEDTASNHKTMNGCLILTEVAQFGRERITKVLDFLNEKEDLHSLFDFSVKLINFVDKSLDEDQKVLLLTASSYLGIDVNCYDWGAENSVASKWIFSLRDQV